MKHASTKITLVSSVADLAGLDIGPEPVLCYGHFNIIHPGHIRFLQHAKSMGKTLIVALRGDRSLSSSGKSLYFPQEERAEGVASLHFVDRIFILDSVDLQTLVSATKPMKLALGKEVEQKYPKELREAITTLEAQGGSVEFHSGEVHYATSDLLHGTQKDLEYARRSAFLQACHRQGIALGGLIELIGRFAQAKILVIGDTIVDQYAACEAIGMSAEAPVLVVRELESREFIGGAGVVAAHVRALGAQCSFLSVVGEDTKADDVRRVMTDQGIDVHLIGDPSRPTTVKIRYMVENQKLFRVSRFKEHALSPHVEQKVIERIRALGPQINGILVSDFVYGVVTDRVLAELQTLARERNIPVYGDLQCSTQVGDVSKFQNFEVLCPTEREARIALGNQAEGLEWVANMLLKKTMSKNMVIKLGSEGFIAYNHDGLNGFLRREHFPALVSNPVDVAGAGDSLLAALATSMCSGGSLMESAAIGACMAALAVQIIGNVPVSHKELEDFIRSLEA